MGVSPIQQLRTEWKKWINPWLIADKHDKLINYYGKDLSGVLRYMFSGNIVPWEIEEAAVVLRRHLHSLTVWQTLKTKSNSSVAIQDFSVSESAIKPTYSVTFINTNWKTERIVFSLVNDPDRWVFPVTEVTWNEATYRSVPFHGDVRNHLYHQNDFYQKEYVTPLIDAWLISWDDATVINLYHKIHDVPEIISWDIYVNDKTWADAHKESSLIRKILVNSYVWYTQQEIDFIANSFLVFEQPTNYFKWWERLNYILDALRAYKTAATFYHQHEHLVGGILQNQLEYFINSKKIVSITPLQWKQNKLPFSYLPSSEVFLKKYGKEIEEILASWSHTHILLMWDAIVSRYNL